MNQTVIKTKRKSNNNGTAGRINKIVNDEDNHR
jgi:hypothetical protein